MTTSTQGNKIFQCTPSVFCAPTGKMCYMVNYELFFITTILTSIVIFYKTLYSMPIKSVFFIFSTYTELIFASLTVPLIFSFFINYFSIFIITTFSRFFFKLVSTFGTISSKITQSTTFTDFINMLTRSISTSTRKRTSSLYLFCCSKFNFTNITNMCVESSCHV